MSWQGNNPGGGSPRRPGSELEEMILQGQERIKQMVPVGSSRGRMGIAIIVLVGLAAWTAYYTVPSDSVAVIQRFGKYLKEVPPGLHFKGSRHSKIWQVSQGSAARLALQAAVRFGCRLNCPG